MRACVRAVARLRAESEVRTDAKPQRNFACEVRACWVFWAGRTRTGATALLKKKSIRSCHFGGILGDFWDQTTVIIKNM